MKVYYEIGFDYQTGLNAQESCCKVLGFPWGMNIFKHTNIFLREIGQYLSTIHWTLQKGGAGKFWILFGYWMPRKQELRVFLFLLKTLAGFQIRTLGVVIVAYK